MNNPDETLYDRVGGSAVVGELIDELYARVLADDELSRFFAGSSVEKIRRIQTEFIGAALDGPMTVSDFDLTRIHQGRGITRAHVTRFVGHLIAVLDARHSISRRDAIEIAARVATYSDQVTGLTGGTDG